MPYKTIDYYWDYNQGLPDETDIDYNKLIPDNADLSEFLELLFGQSEKMFVDYIPSDKKDIYYEEGKVVQWDYITDGIKR